MSCSSQKRVVREQSQSLTNEAFRQHMDSVVRSALTATFEGMAQSASETLTEVVIYDTEKPATDSTGKPPVKAELRQRRTHRAQSASHATVSQCDTTRLTADTATASSASTESQAQAESKPSAGDGTMKTGIGLLLAALAILTVFAVYKRIKH